MLRMSVASRTALVMLAEKSISAFEPLLCAVEESASARQKQGAALRAALEDVGWSVNDLRGMLGHRTGAHVSRYLSGEESIPARIYDVPKVGAAYHARVSQMFGLEQRTA
jgi:hypothetical protein